MPLVKSFVRAVILGCFVALCAPASAFMPASGVWVIEAEENGRPGRGFQLDVENEVVIFYYNGYRADGSSVFYIAFGPIKNNVFSSALREFRGGTVMGSPRKDATELASPGNVSITFSSGMRGLITFPGEAAKAITKFNFGYPKNPDGLMGTYLMAYATKAGVIGDKFTLTRKLAASKTGNGIVTNDEGTMACENITTGVLSGAIACTELSSQPQNDDQYVFRMAGDRGTGIGTWASATLDYPLQVWRTATALGNETGPTNGSQLSLEWQTELADPSEQAALRNARKEAASKRPGTPFLSAEERGHLHRWLQEVASSVQAAP